MIRTIFALLVIIAVGSICSCGSRQSTSEPDFLIEQPAEQETSRAEQVMKALAEAYPKQIDRVEFRDDDWAVLMYGTWYYYANGTLLPENLQENAARYRAVIFYRYPAE